MNEVYLCDGIRTPIGRLGGGLASVRPDDLAALTIKALVERNPTLPTDKIDEVILGCANQAGEDNRNVARMATLLAGLPTSVSGVTVNRLCASGLEAIGSAARAIRCGEADIIIAGGVESMSRAPYVLGKASKAFDRTQTMEDTTIGWRFANPEMKALYGVDAMPETAQNLADELKISRDAQDAFAIRSQMRTAASVDFRAGEIIPVMTGKRDRQIVIDQDEHPRQTSLQTLARLTPIARKEGSVTAGNSSGVNDGAAALLIAGEAAVQRYDLTPRARICGMASAGVEPRVMGIGPVPATKKLLARLGWSIDQMDVIETERSVCCAGFGGFTRIGHR